MANVTHVLCKKCVVKLAKKEEAQKSILKGQESEIKIKPDLQNLMS